MHVIKIEAMFVCKTLMSGNLSNLQLRYVEEGKELYLTF